jgi:phage tail-like protein
MRAVIPRLPTPHPTGERLPGLFQEDQFCLGFVGGLDEVMAPIFAVIDCIDYYIDPYMAPDDFLAWLGNWVGVEIDETWPIERQRAFVTRATDIYRMRGTASGLKAHVGVFTGARVEIAETGGCVWSQTANTPLPGEPEPRMTVRVVSTARNPVNEKALNHLVATAKPAHVVHRVEVVGR